jgi:hypothetical protein
MAAASPGPAAEAPSRSAPTLRLQRHRISKFAQRRLNEAQLEPAHYRRIDMAKAPLIFTYYIAAPVEKVWDGFVSKESNQKIFMGADFEVDLQPGGR